VFMLGQYVGWLVSGVHPQFVIGGGGVDPEAVYTLFFYFKNYAVKMRYM